MSKRIKLKIASPCEANWEAMSGDEAKRFCGSCNQNVYQLSNMSTEEVEELLQTRKGLRTCGRFYQRADGSVITSDCSVGVSQKRKQRVLKVVGAAAFSLSAVGIGAALAPDASKQSKPTIFETTPDPMVMGAIGEVEPEPEPEPERVKMGKIAPEPEDIQMIMGDVAYEPESEPYGTLMGTEIGEAAGTPSVDHTRLPTPKPEAKRRGK